MSERTEDTDDLNMRWLECLRIFQAKTQKAIEGNMRNPYYGHFYHPHGMPLPCEEPKDQRSSVTVDRVIESRSIAAPRSLAGVVGKPGLLLRPARAVDTLRGLFPGARSFAAGLSVRKQQAFCCGTL